MKYTPRILGFLCHWCCYAAADAAGVSRMQYPPHMRVIRVMCTGRIEPGYILRGFIHGADGIFVGGWHLEECHYRSGNYEAINRFELVNIILGDIGVDTSRFTYQWVSAAEGIRFVKVITEFDGRISSLGPFGEKEGGDRQAVMDKLKAAVRTVEERTFRMVFAKQAKQIKDAGTFGKFPAKEKLIETFQKEMRIYQTLHYLEEKDRSAEELTMLLGIPEAQVMGIVETLKKKNMWEGELQ